MSDERFRDAVVLLEPPPRTPAGDARVRAMLAESERRRRVRVATWERALAALEKTWRE